MKSVVGSTLAGVVVLSFAALISASANTSWTGGTSSDWADPLNWSGGVPAPGTGATIINSGVTFTPVLATDSTAGGGAGGFGDVIIHGQLDHSAGTLSSNTGNWSWIGQGGDSAVYNMTGSSSFATNHFFIGDNGTGTMTVNTSGTVTANWSGGWWENGAITLGLADSGNGTLNLQSGTVNITGDAWVGAWGGTGNWSQSGGIANISGKFAVGNFQDFSATSTDGTATIANGTLNAGTVTIARAYTGDSINDNVNGSMTVNSGGILNSEGDLIVGERGASGTSANLTINNGGVVNVASSTLRWMMVGRNGAGNATLTVNTGGTLNLNAGTDLRVSQDGGSGTNVINVDGGKIQGSAIFLKGGNASSTITIQNGGQILGVTEGHDSWDGKTIVKSGGLLETSYVAGASGTAGSGLYIDGGTVRATAGGTGFINYWGGVAEAYISAGGATVDNAGFDVGITGNDYGLVADPGSTGGGVTFTGSGTTTLASTNTYTGATVVSAGTLLVNGSLGNTDVTVADGATIGGSGSLGGSLHFAAGSMLDTTAGTLNLGSAGVSFGGFSFADLGGFDVYSAADGTYTFMTGSNINFTNVANFGAANALNLGGGRSAYFQNGSLQVVVIPEPGAALLGGIGLLALLRRRRIR